MEAPEVDRNSHPLAATTAYLATTFNVVQTIGAIVALCLEWASPCDRNLQLWLVVLVVRMSFRRGVTYLIKRRRNAEPEDTEGDWSTLHKIRELLDVFGLIWFTIGNAWIFGATTCVCEYDYMCACEMETILLNHATFFSFV
jgi:hypothetical protein